MTSTPRCPAPAARAASHERRRLLAAGAILAALLCAATAARAAKQAASPGLSCPTVVTAQYERVAAFSIDGRLGSIEGMTPVFFPRSTLRLVSAQLALAHGGETVPSELLAPDELAIVLGRPMKWTLWDGQPPEPVSVVHLACEYEGGLLLHRPIGRTVRSCSLDTQLQQRPKGGRATAKSPGKAAVRGPEPDDAPGEAAPPPLRAALSRAVFTCR